MSAKSLKPGWKVVKFGDIAQNVAVRVDPADAKTDVYVGLEHLDPSTIHLRQWGHPSDVTGQKLAFKKGDVIFGRRRAYQRKLAVAEFDGICSAHAMVVRAKPKMILPDFLPFFLQSDMFMERAIEISVGSLSPTINWKTLQVQEFPLPPLDEQKRVAEILWAADESIQAKRKTHEDLQVAIQAARNDIFYAAFEGKIPAHRNLLCANRKSGWSVKRLSEVTHKIVDGVHKTPKYTKTGVPFLTVENMTSGPGIDFSSTRFISERDHREFIKRTDSKKGDVLVSKDGTLGVPRLVDTDMEFSIFVSVALLKPIHEVIRSELICHYIESSIFKKHVLMHASGSALKHIHLVDFKSAPIPFPDDLEEQDRLLQRVNSLVNSDRAIRKAISDEQDLIKALSSECMIGAAHV